MHLCEVFNCVKNPAPHSQGTEIFFDHHTRQQMGSLDCSDPCNLESLHSASSWDICCLASSDKTYVCSWDSHETGRGLGCSQEPQTDRHTSATLGFWWCLVLEDPLVVHLSWVNLDYHFYLGEFTGDLANKAAVFVSGIKYTSMAGVLFWESKMYLFHCISCTWWKSLLLWQPIEGEHRSLICRAFLAVKALVFKLKK